MKKVYILWSKENNYGLSAYENLEIPMAVWNCIEEETRKRYTILEAEIIKEVI